MVRCESASRYLCVAFMGAFACALGVGLVACSSDSTTDPSDPPGVGAVAVTPPIAAISPGQTVQYTATVTGTDGSNLTDRAIVWNSSDDAVATVNQAGLATGVAVGNATITATSEGIPGAAITVVQPQTSSAVTTVGAGVDFTCATRSDGQTFCWGANDRGQLGDGTNTSSSTPVAVAGGTRLLAVSADGAGGSASAGLFACGFEFSSSGNAFCWGANDQGQIGDGSTDDQSQPTAVTSGTIYTVVNAGALHACSVQFTGQSWCWGDGANGKLGAGNTNSSTVPVPVSTGLLHRTITAGAEHSCAILLADGTGYCWGFGETGEFGNGNKTSSTVPIAVSVSTSFTTISAGDAHTCAVGVSGIAWCWGLDDQGQVGTGNATASDTCVNNLPCEPTLRTVTGNRTWIDVSAGHLFSCGVTNANEAFCWGSNSKGQLGQDPGTVTSTSTPVPVSGQLEFVRVNTGFEHACGVTASAEAYCWGSNESGQLGDGTMTDSFTPVKVTAPLQ